MPFGTNDEVLFGADDEVVEGTPVASGGPQRGRKYITQAERSKQAREAWNRAPLSTRMTMGPDELMPGGIEARNAANADAGAALLNLGADSTVNLPGHLLGFGAKVAGQIGQNFDPGIDPGEWRTAVTDRTTFPHIRRGDEVLGTLVAPVAEAWQQKVEPKLEKYPLLGAMADTLGTVAEGAGWALGIRGATGALKEMSAASKAARIAHKPYTSEPVASVAQRYTVVPDDAKHSIGTASNKGVTGSTRAALGPDTVNALIPAENAKKATANAVSDLGHQLTTQNGRVDAGLLDAALDAESVPYQQLEQLGTPRSNTLAQRVRAAWEANGGTLKGDAVADARLQPLMDPTAPPLPTGELLTRWKELNGYAAKLRKEVGEGSAAAQIKSADLRKISDAILDEMQQRAEDFGAAQLIPELKQARVNIARLHALGDSLDSVGWVDPAKVLKMKEDGVPLTGALAQLAEDTAAAPRSLIKMGSAVDSTRGGVDQYGRQAPGYMREMVGHLLGNRVARGGVEKLNEELRAGSGLLRREAPPAVVPPLYPPNAGPQPFVGPEAPGPFSPWNGPLSLAPDMPEGFYEGLPRNALGGGAQPFNGRRLAEGQPFTLEGQSVEAPPLDAFSEGMLPWEPPGKVPPFRGPVQSISDQLGVGTGQNLPLDIPPGTGLVYPRGVSPFERRELRPGRAAPRGLELLPDVGRADFGPGDEFPGAAPAPAPVAPRGPSPAAPAGAVADMLSLAPEQGPGAPRFDVTEAAPGASAGLFADQFLMPGAQRMENPTGLIDYIPGELGWRITNQFTPEAMRGQGAATQNLVELAKKAQSAGVPLNSDTSITDAIARLMLGARARGQLTFDEANALRMQQLLQEGQPVLRSSVPWFQNIEPGQ